VQERLALERSEFQRAVEELQHEFSLTLGSRDAEVQKEIKHHEREFEQIMQKAEMDSKQLHSTHDDLAKDPELEKLKIQLELEKLKNQLEAEKLTTQLNARKLKTQGEDLGYFEILRNKFLSTVGLATKHDEKVEDLSSLVEEYEHNVPPEEGERILDHFLAELSWFSTFLMLSRTFELIVHELNIFLEVVSLGSESKRV
jgi:hypothetical protein